MLPVDLMDALLFIQKKNGIRFVRNSFLYLLIKKKFEKQFVSSACECEFDKLGRINIPTNLRALAHLEKECVIIGAGNHGEIWSQEKWNQYYNDNQDSYDDILESLDDFSL